LKKQKICNNHQRDRLNREDHFKLITFFLLLFLLRARVLSENLLADLCGIRGDRNADKMIRYREEWEG